MIQQATKKPITIKFVQLTKHNIREVYEFIYGPLYDGPGFSESRWFDYLDIVAESGMCIPTLEGDMTALIGDFIIEGVQGEFYPCKPDIFHETYDVIG